MTLFWRNNDVIIAPCVQGVGPVKQQQCTRVKFNAIRLSANLADFLLPCSEAAHSVWLARFPSRQNELVYEVGGAQAYLTRLPPNK